MENIQFELTQEYIELFKLLKITGIAESGAQAKKMIENGEVTLNATPEKRKRAKIRKDDLVQIFDVEIKIA